MQGQNESVNSRGQKSDEKGKLPFMRKNNPNVEEVEGTVMTTSIIIFDFWFYSLYSILQLRGPSVTISSLSPSRGSGWSLELLLVLLLDFHRTMNMYKLALTFLHD